MRFRIRRTTAAAAGGLLLALALPAAAAADTTFGEPTAAASFGETIEFVQPARMTGVPERLEILLELPGAIGPHVVTVPAAGEGAVTLRHELLLADGHILPNTPITARWRVTDADGGTALGPPVTVRYEDDRFDWATREGDVVRVHWHEGGQSFGNRALEIGERAVDETAELLGVTEDEPVDFFVYANQDEFYDALGPGTRENVGGQANAEIRTLFALITPGEIDDAWVEVVIPHELVHLVFDTAVDNPYDFPPRWLNEGLATYLSQGYAASDRGQVEDAARDGSLMPLDALADQFPTTFERFGLAYAESVSAVDFLIREYGQDALVGLIRSYADGRTDDEAFDDALGLDLAAFDAAWRADLDAVEPAVHGPQPAPPGPLPPGWLGEDGQRPPTPAPGAPDVALLAVLGAALAVVAVGVTLWVRRRATPPSAGPESGA